MLVMLLSSLCVSAQTQKVTQIGSTFKVEKSIEKSKDQKSNETKTSFTIEVDGKRYPIYKGSRGGYYYYDFQGKKKYVPKEVRDKLKKQSYDKHDYHNLCSNTSALLLFIQRVLHGKSTRRRHLKQWFFFFYCVIIFFNTWANLLSYNVGNRIRLYLEKFMTIALIVIYLMFGIPYIHERLIGNSGDKFWVVVLAIPLSVILSPFFPILLGSDIADLIKKYKK